MNHCVHGDFFAIVNHTNFQATLTLSPPRLALFKTTFSTNHTPLITHTHTQADKGTPLFYPEIVFTSCMDKFFKIIYSKPD